MRHFEGGRGRFSWFRAQKFPSYYTLYREQEKWQVSKQQGQLGWCSSRDHIRICTSGWGYCQSLGLRRSLNCWGLNRLPPSVQTTQIEERILAMGTYSNFVAVHLYLLLICYWLWDCECYYNCHSSQSCWATNGLCFICFLFTSTWRDNAHFTSSFFFESVLEKAVCCNYSQKSGFDT